MKKMNSKLEGRCVEVSSWFDHSGSHGLMAIEF